MNRRKFLESVSAHTIACAFPSLALRRQEIFLGTKGAFAITIPPGHYRVQFIDPNITRTFYVPFGKTMSDRDLRIEGPVVRTEELHHDSKLIESV